MNRLIVSGIPCPSASWDKVFFAEKNVNQKIIPFIHIFSKHYYKNEKFSDLIQPILELIIEFKPDQIVLHDIGVTLGISALSLLSEYCISPPTVIIFNGAFKGFNVNKSDHPIRIQKMSYQEFEDEVINNGGDVDPQYKDHFSGIKKLYQQISDVSLRQLAENRHNHSKINIGNKILILASRNDKYIHFECLEILNRILIGSVFNELNYGHFPYSGDIKLIKDIVDDFQNNI